MCMQHPSNYLFLDICIWLFISIIYGVATGLLWPTDCPVKFQNIWGTLRLSVICMPPFPLNNIAAHNPFFKLFGLLSNVFQFITRVLALVIKKSEASRAIYFLELFPQSLGSWSTLKFCRSFFF